jgi:restriction system protein
VVELKGHLYLVEMKWEEPTLGRDNAAPPALTDCREALREKIVILCKLEEIMRAIEQQYDLKKLLYDKINEAVIHKNPYFVLPC